MLRFYAGCNVENSRWSIVDKRSGILGMRMLKAIPDGVEAHRLRIPPLCYGIRTRQYRSIGGVFLPEEGDQVRENGGTSEVNSRSFDCASRDETARGFAQDDAFSVYLIQLHLKFLYVDVAWKGKENDSKKYGPSPCRQSALKLPGAGEGIAAW
jgi:hypothetical protein